MVVQEKRVSGEQGSQRAKETLEGSGDPGPYSIWVPKSTTPKPDKMYQTKSTTGTIAIARGSKDFFLS